MSSRFTYYRSNIAFDPDVQAFITAANITDSVQQDAISNLVAYYKANNVWTKFLAFYPMVGGTAFSHKFNLINPLDTNAAYRLIFTGGWIHSATGAKPNGTNAYAETFFNASIGWTTINNSGIGFYSRTNFRGLQNHPYGVFNGSTSSCEWDTSPAAIQFFQGGLLSCFSSNNTLGHNIANRFSSNNFESYQNAIQVGSNTNILSVGGPAFNIYLGATNNNGLPDGYAPHECAGFHIHQNLTLSDILTVTTGLANFNTALGRSVNVIPIDSDAQLIFDAASNAGSPFIEPYLTRINNTVIALKTAGNWNILGCLFVDAMIDTDVAEADRKNQVLIDMKNPSNVAGLHNDYVGSHIGGIGFLGDGGAFGILTLYNAFADGNWSRNAAQWGMLMLNTNNPANFSQDLSACASGFTSWNILARTNKNEGESLINDAAIPGTYSYRIDKGNSLHWLGSKRSNANLTEEFINGALVTTDSQPSTAVVSVQTARFGAFDGAWVNGFYTTSKQGAFYTCSLSGNRNKIEEIINDNLLAPIGKYSYFNKMIFAQGDSILSGSAYGHYSRMYNKTIDDLNDNWTLTNLNFPNQLATTIDTEFAVHTAPFYRSYFNKNIFYVECGINDLVTGTQNGTGLYNIIKSICLKAKAAGWLKVVVSGLSSVSIGGNGVGQAVVTAETLIYNNLMLADFNLPHGTITNYYTSNLVTYADGFVNLQGDSRYTTVPGPYFDPDNIHFSDLGNDTYSTDYCTPIIQTF